MSKATIRIPTPLRSFTGGADEVEVAGETVGQVLTNLGERHSGVIQRVMNGEGGIRPFVNIYLGSKNIKTLDGLDTAITEGAVLSIVPAVAGGAR